MAALLLITILFWNSDVCLVRCLFHFVKIHFYYQFEDDFTAEKWNWLFFSTFLRGVMLLQATGSHTAIIKAALSCWTLSLLALFLHDMLPWGYFSLGIRNHVPCRALSMQVFISTQTPQQFISLNNLSFLVEGVLLSKISCFRLGWNENLQVLDPPRHMVAYPRCCNIV